LLGVLLVLLLVLLVLVGRVGGGYVKDVMTILLWWVWLGMGRSFGGIGRLSWALVRLVMMRRVVLMLRRLRWIGHETCELFGKIHGGLRRIWVCLAERVGNEVRDEHVIWIELRLGRRRGWYGWRRGRKMKTLLSDLRFIGRRLVEGH
jgi:hypothetical protein